jgi:hypothetical protein
MFYDMPRVVEAFWRVEGAAATTRGGFLATLITMVKNIRVLDYAQDIA